jgi:hypothetical protein
VEHNLQSWRTGKGNSIDYIGGIHIMNTQYEFHLEYTFASDALAELNRRITLLLTTPVGTMPLDREFGTDWTFLDMPSEAAKSLFAADR